MKNVFFTIALLFIITSCKESNVAIKKTGSVLKEELTISGTVHQNDSSQEDITTFEIYYFDNETNVYEKKSTGLNEDGSFSLDLELKHSSLLYGYAGDQFLMFLSQGEDVQLDITSANNQDELEVTYLGDNATTHNAVKEYFSSSPVSTEKFFDENSNLSLNDLDIYLKSKKEAYHNYNNKYLKDNNLPADFKNIINANNKYYLTGQRLEYLSFAQYIGEEIPSVENDYFDGMKNLPDFTTKDLKHGSLASSISRSYINYQRELLAAQNPEIAPGLLQEATLNKILEDTERPLLSQLSIYTTLRNHLENHSLEFYERNKVAIEKQLANTDYLTNIKSKYTYTKQLLEQPQIPAETELLTFKSTNPADFIKEIIANANGKVVYIDNWATWCGPCKEEFKEASPALHEKFKEHVEFIYLCHASKEKTYLPSIAAHNIKGKHYFLTEEQGNVVQQQIKLEGFPTYTIFDKKGNQVLSDYIHRPSHGPTSDILTKLINNKEVSINTNPS